MFSPPEIMPVKKDLCRFVLDRIVYEVEYQKPESYKDFRIAIGGGYAFRLGKIEKTGDPGIDDLNKQLRHGFNIDADAQYFFKESWGLGLNANYCVSSTSGSNISLPDMDQPVSAPSIP